MRTQLKADLMLVLVTLCWGVSYLLMDISLSEMGPFTLNSYRFLIAFFVAMLIAFPKLRNVNKTTLKYSAFVAISLVFVYIGATFGVMHTSLSNAGFLCALTVLFTPILSFVLYRQIPEKKILLVVLMCIIGIGLLTLNEQLKPAVGDLLCMLCAFAYSVDLLITEKAVSKEEVNAFQLGVYQLGFTGIFNLIIAFIVEEPSIPSTPSIWASVLFLAIFCTGVAFIVQAIAQQYTSAAHVGIIFALEPVFAGIVAFIFADEVLLPRAYFGALLMIAGLFIMEIDFTKLRIRKQIVK